ncbi:MAG: SusC/RagA family TonB-linked outer membrane protein [Ferruginibacter sp.]|nr:SusC/RagA family TonB-linked outer membrane protein [Ferruginibacter sp.]
MRRLLPLFAVLMLAGMFASAQSRVITGKVRDIPGDPVKFATVTETGTKNAVNSDENGDFSIKVKSASSTLTITAVGYDAQTVSPTGSLVIANLVRNNQELSAVVVTALGQVRQKSSIGYSTASIKTKELTQANPVNLQNGLTGKVSGLNVATTNSGVLGTTRITLRGIRSLTGNNQPMLVVDGVPTPLGFLNSINPNDIADVSLLKSASATVIYGPDGVNGAIVVTTKRGSKQRPMITVSHTTQLEKIAYMPKFQTRWGSGYNQDPNTGQGSFDPIEQQSWGDEFDGSIRQMGQDGPNGEKLLLPYSYNPNGRRNFFATGSTNQTDVSYSTGDFYLSAQNVSIRGTVPGDKNDRRTVAMSAQKEYGRFKASFNVRYTNSNYDVTTANTLIYYNVTGAPGQYDLSRFKNWRTDYFSSPNGYYTPYLVNFQRTPYMTKDINRQKGKSNDLLGNVELSFKAASWLNFVYRLGGSATNGNAKGTREAFTPSAYHLTLRDASSTTISAAVSDAFNSGSRLSSELFANINTKYKTIGISATLGQSYRENNSNDIFVSSSNLGTSTFLSIQNRIGEPIVGVGATKSRLTRLFGRVGLDFDGKAYVEGTASYDRDSRNAPRDGGSFTNSDISYFYPGVNASILLHKLIPSLTSNKVLNYFKLRGAISKTGNVPLVPQQDPNFTVATFFPFGSTLGYNTPTSLFQRQFRPEFVINREVGIELGFLKNRINFEASYYTQDNTNQVLDLQLPISSGFTSSKLNAAEFTNTGVELDLKLTPLVKIGDLNVDLKFNYTYQTSKVTQLVEGVNELGIGNYNWVIVGQPVYKFRLTDYVRDPASGKVIVGADGMPTLNPNLTTFGRTTPSDIFGISLNANYKGFTLSAVAEYRGGNQIVVDQLGGFLDDNGISQRSAQYGRRAFVWPNSVVFDGIKYVNNTNVYTKTYNREFWNSDLNTEAVTNYLCNGAFWKLREVSLSYEFPSRIFKGNTLRGVTVSVSGRNLLTWLPKSNQWTDPEFSSAGGGAYTGNAQGRSTGYNLPPTRIFGGSVIFNF